MRSFPQCFLRFVAPLFIAPIFSASADPILRIDADDADALAPDTAANFSRYVLGDDTLSLPPYSIDINPAGGASLDDFARTTPADGGGLALAPLFRDGVFVAGGASPDYYRIGLDARIAGLTPGRRYNVTAWSYDSGSTGARAADWSLLGLGGPWFGVNDRSFDGATAPASDAANSFTLSAVADGSGQLTLRGRNSASTSTAQVFLNGFTVEEAPDGPVQATATLAVDFNDRGGAGPAATQPGFEEFLLGGAEGAAQTSAARAFGGFNVTLTAVGGTMDDRLRTTPGNTGPFTDALLLRDFIFVPTGGTGLDARVTGLEPGQQYLVELWVFDSGSSGAGVRASGWTAGGAALWEDYQFNGGNSPATNDDYKMAGIVAATGAGDLLISGRVTAGTTPSVFIDALRISKVAPAVAVDLGHPILSEFLADNEDGITDEDGDSSDWIEIWNSTPNDIDLAGWHLTDDPADRMKWTFPANTLLAAQARLIVWASGKNRTANPAAPHTSFSLNKSAGAYLAFVQPNGADVVTEFTNLPSQRADISYGLAGTAEPLTAGYFQPPTPGGPNGTPVPGFISDTTFSPKRGFYTAPFNVQISTLTEGAVIHYTTDGSEPTESSPVYPGGAGIPIATTTVLRAKAFKAPLAPTNTDTQTYIFNADAAVQPANPPGWPATWGIDSEVNANDGAGNGTVPSNYQMDPVVVNNTQPGHSVPEALAALPVLSVTLPLDDFLSPGSGIYSNPRSVGDAWERACSIEWIDPDGPGFHERAGIRVHGNSGRRPFRMQKHSFRLAFRAIYGAGKLNYRLFPQTKVAKFDKLVLRNFFTDGWGLVSWSQSRYRPDDSVSFRDVWIKQSGAAMGHTQTATRFAHLYINGLYWGFYDISERIDDIFLADHFGGLPEDWDLLGDFTDLKAGSATAWNSLFALVNSANLAIPANYQQVLDQVDMVDFIDYYLLHVHSDAEDWPHHNGYAFRNHTDPASKWRFLVWDQEIILDNHAIDRLSSGAGNTGTDRTAGRLYQRLRASPEFRLLFADRAHKQLHNDGALNLVNCQQRWQGIADQLDQAIVAESARWGDTASTTPYGNTPSKPRYTREADWLPSVASVKNTYLPALYNNATSVATIRKLQAQGLYPNTAPPDFAQHGGNVPTGYELAIAAAAGEIYYTLDGSDPREAFSSNALGTLYAGPVPLSQTATVKARARNGGEWSAATEATFIAGTAASAITLAVSELNYHPPVSEEHEFIELMNYSTGPIDLTGVHFTAGLTFTFPQGYVLAGGARVLVVKNIAEFEARYGAGLPVAGQYEGNLDNAGEEIALAAANGSEIFRFTYNNKNPWPRGADGNGRSLILMSSALDPTNAASWRSSTAADGNPGATDSVAFTGAPADDADADGLTAGYEHAAGTSDTVSSPEAVPVLSIETFTPGGIAQPFLTLTARRNLAADTTRMDAEFSTDLSAWSSDPADVKYVGETIAPDGTAMLRWRSIVPVTTDPERQFLRVRVTLTP